ncbi:MAG: hypothetical protein GY756_09945 [bacterium]|nr:hypothetical protein [bacterium]
MKIKYDLFELMGLGDFNTSTKKLNFLVSVAGIVFLFFDPENYQVSLIMLGISGGGQAIKNITQKK